VYVNGTAMDSDLCNGTLAWYNNINSYSGGNYFFNGSIDEVMVFNRTLSSTEIKALYSSQINKFNTSAMNLSNGQHNYTVYAIDEYGNAANSGWRNFNFSTGLLLRIINPTTANSLSVSSGDNISIYFNYSYTNSTNITSGVTINNVTIGGNFSNILINTMSAGEYFEGSFLPTGWKTGGNASWNKNTTYTVNGSACAASGPGLASNSKSWINYTNTFSNDGYVSFYWNVSSEQSWDYLCFVLIVHWGVEVLMQK
jgi:hypothetical protein